MAAKLPNSGDPLTERFPKGPAVGDSIPDFVLPDQLGDLVDYRQMRGRKRALILFHRSAAW
ncbi:MAG: hypothetical protein CL878_14165 [Dehalococcoidia bacterium]|nr:hypothetical protein [Dehalococcoidia bacterium]